MIRRTIATMAAVLAVVLAPTVTMAGPGSPGDNSSATQSAICACKLNQGTAAPARDAAVGASTSTTTSEELNRIWTSP
jgi:hypothetical protein